MGGLNALLSGAQGGMGNAAARQDFLNQQAFQGANATFARWQADFSRRVVDSNSQHAYWQETVNYNQNLGYARSLRNYELVRAVNQAEVVGQTRAAGGADFVRSSEAIGQAMAERSMQDAVAYMQYTTAALKARANVSAGSQEGATVDRLIADFDRQVGDYHTVQQINQALQRRQFTRQQAGAVAQYLSAYNSQAFYEAQPYLEPIAPFVPLPALLEAPPPSMRGAAPGGGGGSAINIGSALLGGINAGMGTYQRLKPYTDSGKGGAAAVARSGFGG